ncbi:MAG: hypothetical protein JEY99_02970 [Spirochaetales bacterium]|nr:hypothetical protein [Spirochaetales bacterium]
MGFVTDYGGSLQNLSNITYDLDRSSTLELKSLLSQSNKLTFWYQVNPCERISLSGQVGWLFRYLNSSINYQYDFYEDFSDVKPLELLRALEVFRLDFELISPLKRWRAISFKAGRWPVEGGTNYILRGTLDGLDIHFRGTDSSFRAGIWYNGFIDKTSSSILLTRADKNSFLDHEKIFASPRFLEYCEFRYRTTACREYLLFSAAQLGIYRDERIFELGGGRYSSGYLGGGMNGSVTPVFFYSILAALNGGLYTWPDSEVKVFQLSRMVEAGFRYFPGGAFLPEVKLDFLYTSGDDWDRADWEGSSFSDTTSVTSLFMPLTGEPLGSVFQPKPGNITLGKIECSFKPFHNFQLAFVNTLFYRSVVGPISVDTIAYSKECYLGDEILLYIKYRPCSDLGLSMTSGLFFPNEALVSSSGMVFRANFYLSLVF